MSKITRVDFVEMDKDDLEFRVSSEFTPKISEKRFQVISAEEARELYFFRQPGKTNVYPIIGGQKGDEGKGMAAKLTEMCDPDIRWTLAPNSTHNAGKGVHTKDESGKEVKVSLHLCPATLVDPHVFNYIGSNTQINLFSLEKEIIGMQNKTGRKKLGVDYHLMVDSYANLVVPTNRADDIVGKENAMGSTVVGATSSASNATGKTAPLLEHLLYDHKQFLRSVKYQIREFDDRIKHDKEFVELGVDSMIKLGISLQDKSLYSKNKRLETLAQKLSQSEIQFFTEKDPAQYLLEQYISVCDKGLFFIGDTKTEINKLITQGIPGSIEGVQSCLLSGPVKYSKNRTAAGTHSSSTIGDAGLNPDNINYRRILVFKFANTSVGGNDITISGFIKQDALYKLEAEKDGQMISFEKTETLGDFLTKEQSDQAFHELTEAFFHAVEKGYSLRKSKVRIEGINMEISLAEARALLTAYRWGERGETSGRARICRFDDMVETGVVYNFEGHPLQIRNALDRAMDLPKLGLITAYQVVKEYGGYNIGDIIKPGMQLRQEHLTAQSCMPIVHLMPTWSSIASDGTNELEHGKILNPDLCRYLNLVSDGSKIMAIGAGPKLASKVYIKEI